MAKRIKIPKRIAGVKIPKTIRKGPIVDFLNTPAGEVVLAQAVLLIGGAFTIDKARDNGAMLHPLDTLKDAGKDLRDKVGAKGGRLTQAFAAAAHAFRDAMEATDEQEPSSSGTAEADLDGEGTAAGGEPSDSGDPVGDPIVEAPEGSRKKGRVRSESPATPH